MSSGLGHVVPEILRAQALEFLVRLHGKAGPFLVDEAGEDGVFLALPDIMVGPVVGEFIRPVADLCG